MFSLKELVQQIEPSNESPENQTKQKVPLFYEDYYQLISTELNHI